jgi:predicted ester cyclase
MSQSHSKALARRYFDERWNKRNLEVIDELVADDYFSDAEEKEAFKGWHRETLAVFSEYMLTMEDLVAEGEKVLVPWSVTAVLQTPYEGVGSPGERVQFGGFALLRIVDGKIMEDTAYSEGFGSVLLGQTYESQ